MALWTVKLDIQRGRLWLQEAVNPADQRASLRYIYIYILVSVYECYATRVNVLIHLPPAVCPQDSLAAYAHTKKTIFHHWWRLLSGGRRKPSASPPSVPPPPQVSERLLGRGLEVKLYSLFGWGWRYLVRAAGLLAFLEMGDLAT